jgi:hypothetical protein
MNTEKELDDCAKSLRKEFKLNHQKVLHSFYKAYLAECYARGESIDLRDHILNHEIVREDGKIRNKYWLTKRVS